MRDSSVAARRGSRGRRPSLSRARAGAGAAMLKAWVTRLVTFAAGRAGLTAALGLLLAAAALAYAATHFAITTDSAALISPKVAWRQDEARLSKAFPQQNDLTVVVVDGRTPELAEDAAARLADRLAADRAHFLNVRRPDGGPFFAREGLLLRSTDEVRATTEGAGEGAALPRPAGGRPEPARRRERLRHAGAGGAARRDAAGRGGQAPGQARGRVHGRRRREARLLLLAGAGGRGGRARRPDASLHPDPAEARLRRAGARRRRDRGDPRRRERSGPGRGARPERARHGLGAPVGRGVRLPVRQGVAGDGRDAAGGALHAVGSPCARCGSWRPSC